MRNFYVEKAGAVLLGMILLASHAYSQSDRAQISGFVTDPSRAHVPKASVTVQNEATHLENQTKTNESGYYAFPGLPPGLYTIKVEATGFKAEQITSAHLDAGINMSVNVELKLGVTTESVQVTADASAVQSETATVGKLVTQEQVQSLELNGRSPLYLAQLVPGVVRCGAISSFSYSTDDSININGSRLQENSITVDGAPAIRVRANGTSIVAAYVDATQEVQVLTADYLPEYGRSSGGQIRIVTKSGTSQFHGTAYEYFRNSALDANSWSRNASKIPGVAPFRFISETCS